MQSLCAGILFILGGCAGPEVKTDLLPEDFLNPECAFEIFLQGEYKTASEHFDILRTVSENPKHRRQALFGLACSRMMLAANAEQFREAINIWKSWTLLFSQTPSGEDPRILDPILERFATGDPFADYAVDTDYPETEDEKQPDISPPSVSPEDKKTESSRKTDSPTASEKILQKTVRKKDREIRTLKEKIEKMGKQIDTLTKQLNSLEEIHQEINQKKKDMISQ